MTYNLSVIIIRENRLDWPFTHIQVCLSLDRNDYRPNWTPLSPFIITYYCYYYIIIIIVDGYCCYCYYYYYSLQQNLSQLVQPYLV